jgi:hypothetical protein
VSGGAGKAARTTENGAKVAETQDAAASTSSKNARKSKGVKLSGGTNAERVERDRAGDLHSKSKAGRSIGSKTVAGSRTHPNQSLTDWGFRFGAYSSEDVLVGIFSTKSNAVDYVKRILEGEGKWMAMPSSELSTVRVDNRVNRVGVEIDRTTERLMNDLRNETRTVEQPSEPSEPQWPKVPRDQRFGAMYKASRSDAFNDRIEKVGKDMLNGATLSNAD